MSAVAGPLRVFNASTTYRSAVSFRRAFVAFWIASLRQTINGDGGDSAVIRGYALKTSKVRTSLLGLVVSLTAFTAI
jgi:hypothetical protein